MADMVPAGRSPGRWVVSFCGHVHGLACDRGKRSGQGGARRDITALGSAVEGQPAGRGSLAVALDFVYENPCLANSWQLGCPARLIAAVALYPVSGTPVLGSGRGLVRGQARPGAAASSVHGSRVPLPNGQLRASVSAAGGGIGPVRVGFEGGYGCRRTRKRSISGISHGAWRAM